LRPPSPLTSSPSSLSALPSLPLLPPAPSLPLTSHFLSGGQGSPVLLIGRPRGSVKTHCLLVIAFVQNILINKNLLKERGERREKEGRKEGGKEGRREGGKERGREGGQEGRREGGQEGRREGEQEGRREGGRSVGEQRTGGGSSLHPHLLFLEPPLPVVAVDEDRRVGG
jgi:hypothetical protein